MAIHVHVHDALDYGTSEGARKRAQGGSRSSPSERTRGNYHPAPKPAAKPTPTPERQLTSPFGGPGSKSPYQGMNKHHYQKAKEAEAAGHKPNSQGWLKHILGDSTTDYGTAEGARKRRQGGGSTPPKNESVFERAKRINPSRFKLEEKIMNTQMAMKQINKKHPRYQEYKNHFDKLMSQYNSKGYT